MIKLLRYRSKEQKVWFDNKEFSSNNRNENSLIEAFLNKRYEVNYSGEDVLITIVMNYGYDIRYQYTDEYEEVLDILKEEGFN